MSEETKTKAADTIKAGSIWLSAAIKFMSVLEAFLPAFLVAWADYLKDKNNALKGRLELQKIEMAALERKVNDVKENPRTIIGRLLKSKLRSK